MTTGPAWVAASVRARAIAQRRVGAGRAELLASANTLDGALNQLAETSYGPRLAGSATLSASQHALSSTVLWRLRVLAGWMPASAATLTRAAAAGFERYNIVGHVEQLRGSDSAGSPFDLGTLATAWTRVRATSSMAAVLSTVRSSAWGDPGQPETPGALMDVLTVSWLRRLAATAPAARSWAAAACALLAARMRVVDNVEPAERVVALARPLIGSDWTSARDLTGLASALPRSVRPALADIGAPSELWWAEARLGTVIESDALALLRGSLPGPDIVLGALAVTAVDAWRLRATLAAAAAATGASTTGLEVRHVMA